VLAPNAKLRKLVVPRPLPKGQKRKPTTTSRHAPDPIKPKSEEEDLILTAPLTWAQRLKRVFSIDITLCPKCGGTLRVIADVTDPVTIRKILDHVAQPPPSTEILINLPH
jgi:transposase